LGPALWAGPDLKPAELESQGRVVNRENKENGAQDSSPRDDIANQRFYERLVAGWPGLEGPCRPGHAASHIKKTPRGMRLAGIDTRRHLFSWPGGLFFENKCEVGLARLPSGFVDSYGASQGGKPRTIAARLYDFLSRGRAALGLTARLFISHDR